jgi:hypothetical protein
MTNVLLQWRGKRALKRLDVGELATRRYTSIRETVALLVLLTFALGPLRSCLTVAITDVRSLIA